MSHAEFVAWREFYRQAPFDDLHRFHRPAAMVATSMAGGDVQARLEWLAPPRQEPTAPGYSAADMATFKAFGVKPPTRRS